MLKVVRSFADDILWPEFTQLADALKEYLDEATERIIREEVFKDTEDPSEF
jgi:tRNA nucleotidyltransferase (CCA-adding enzyme)